jgi:hypothetical protein
MQRHGPSCLTGPLSRLKGKSFRARSAGAAEDAGSSRPARAPLTEAERQVRIARIRREIAEGVYDTPAKFALALDALLRRLESGE